MKLKCGILICLFSCCLALQQALAPEKLTGNPCISKETCGECITADQGCAWCSQEDFTSDGSRRCDYAGNLRGKCVEDQIFVPGNTMSKMRDENMSDKGVQEHDAIQIKPQEIKLKLRPNSPFPLVVDFRQAVDYPVDLYYLMDLSHSMKDDKDNLAELGNLLSDEMGKITSNFRLGFGSFVDKVVMPYVSTVPEKLKEPCTDCAAPYGFLNHMPLSLDTKNFSKEVREARVSGNLDAPEGGFDAIMQAVVCKGEIGWREKSRKMLVFSSDSGFHYAGDGKLGGIVKPNDGFCHLDSDGRYYTESTNQDYPSLSQINHKIQENKVNIIFAVTENQVPVYERLSELLEGSSAGKLESDSSNVVDLVRSQYDKITSAIEMKDNAGSDVQVTYYSSCLGGPKQKTSMCKGLKVGNNVTFEANIEILSCPKDRSKWNQTFQIYPVGINEALTVHLEMICECDCEKPWEEERKSPKCSDGNGTYECGICSCDDNRYGKLCECDATGSEEADDKACIFANDTKPCSGRGTCRCGRCECTKRPNPNEEVSGEFCECDNFSCDRANGEICSGPDHGKCVCNVCVCNPGWIGPDCSCKNTTKTCIAPNDNKICSGHGDCECGECKCYDLDEGRYSGTYCERCPTCPLKCDAYRDCVECQIFRDDTDVPPENCTACPFITIAKDKIEVEEENEKLCVFRDDKDCQFTFKYKLDKDDQLIVHAQRTKDCPEPVNILAIVLGVIGGIIAIGLALLLIWKLLTTIHDRRELAKFEKERQMARWDTGENPIYKQATSTFKNPMYGGKQ